MKGIRSASFAVAIILMPLAGAIHGEDIKTPRTDFYGDPLPSGAVARLGTIRLRHVGADVAFSNDGKHLISCGSDGEVRVWDSASDALRRRQRLAWKPRKEEWILATALSPGGKTAVVVTRTVEWPRTVYLYDTRTGKERGRFTNIRGIFAFSPDGTVLALEMEDDQHDLAIHLWTIAEGEFRRLRKVSSPHPLAQIVFAPNGKWLAGINSNYEISDGHDDEIHLWDAVTGEEISKNERGRTRGLSIAFSPDSKTLAVGPRSKGRVRLLDAATFKERAVLQAPAKVKADAIGSLTFSPDGQWLGGSYDSGTDTLPSEYGVLLWDMVGAKEARRLPEEYNSQLTFAPDSKTLACYGGISYEIRLWDMDSGRRRHRRPSHPTLVRWAVSPVLAASPDGRFVASNSRDGMYLWNAATGEALLQSEGSGGYGDHPCFFSSDSKRLLGVGPKDTLQMWDIAAGQELRGFETRRSPRKITHFLAAGLSADGKRVTTIVYPDPAELIVWDTATGKQLSRRPYKLVSRVSSHLALSTVSAEGQAAFAPDGASVSVLLLEEGAGIRGPSGLGLRLALEETSTGYLLVRLPKGVGLPVTFSPRGRLLAAPTFRPKKDPFLGDDVTGLSLIEAASGEEALHLAMEDFHYLAFTADGRGVITADGNGLHVWDTDTGERLYQMAWPQEMSAISCLAALPGGRAATGTSEGEILIWDLAPATWPTRKPARDVSGAKLDTLWSDLTGDARKAHRAIHTLAAVPAQTVSFLKERLQPVTVDVKRIETLLADLDGDSFETREAATGELARMRYRTEPILRRAREKNPSLEMRRRIDALLAGPNRPPTEALRTLRAIAALERIDTVEARRILEKLAGGAAAPETRAAQAALQRLERR